MRAVQTSWPNTTKQGIDWIVYFYVLLLDACWDCNDQRLSMHVCLLSGHAANDGHRIPDQGALSLCLCFKKDKLWTPCFSFAERIAWQAVDYFGVEINWLQPVRRWRIERGAAEPRTRHAKMWPRETSWKWWMLNMIMIARDTCSLAMWLCFLSPSWVRVVFDLES